jgi:hypothetical protein
MATKIGIAGITGKFGRLLARSLLRRDDTEVRGYCRNSSNAPSWLTSIPAVTLHQGEAFGADAIRSFVRGLDVVVCAYLGDPKLMVDGQKALIDACEAEGVPRYVASDWCLDYTKLQLGELFPKDPMIHVKAYLDQKTSVQGVHILVGGFMDPQFSPLFGLWDPLTQTLRHWGTGDEIWEGTSYENAADFTAAVCVDKEASGVLRCESLMHAVKTTSYSPSFWNSLVLGDRKSFKQIAESFGNVYGIDPKLESLGTLQELHDKMHAIRAEAPHEFFNYMFL